MIDPPVSIHPDNPHGLPLVILAQIDHVCVDFEQKLKRGEPTAIEQELERACQSIKENGDVVHNAWRSTLLIELISLEMDYLGPSSKSATRKHYRNRFPDDAETIDSVFDGETAERSNRSANGNVDWGEDLPVNELTLTSKFRMLRYHARGGLGVVYVAHDPQHDRDVVVKFARKRHPEAADQIRLAREAAITGRLEHPGIVPVYATQSGVQLPKGDPADRNLPCFVMQFLDGETLKAAAQGFHERFDEEKTANRYLTREFRRLLSSLISVCNTVAYAHEKGVIHRDIKPANIMLGKFGKTILLDWGLAKAPNELRPSNMEERDWQLVGDASTWDGSRSATLPGQPMGTPEFASPEQVLGRVHLHNESSDVYSLGATLYFMLTGRRPLEVKNLIPDISCWETIPTARQVADQVPLALNAICAKTMSPDQSQRYDSAEQMALDLEQYLADEPVSAFADPWHTKIRRWAHRKPRTAAGLVAGLLVGMAGLAIGSMLLQNERSKLANVNRSLSQANLDLQSAIEDTVASRDEALGSLRWLTDHGIKNSFASRESLDNRHLVFLEEVRQRYSDYARLQPETAAGNAIRAEGNFRIAQVHQTLGELDIARKYLKESCELFRKSDLSNSKDLQIIAGRARMEHGQTLMDTGNVKQGLKELKEARKQLAHLLKIYPDEPDILDNLANACNSLGTIHRSVATRVQQDEFLQQAKSCARQLIDRHPSEPDYNSLLSGIINNQGLQQLDRGQLEQAMKLFVEAEEIQQHLVKDYPGSARFREHLVTMLYNISRVHFKRREYSLAVEHAVKSIEHGERLVADFPGVPANTTKLANSLCLKADATSASGDREAAFAVYQLALSKVEDAIERAPETIAFHRSRNHVLNRFGIALCLSKRLDEGRRRFEESVSAASEFARLSGIERDQVDHAKAVMLYGRSFYEASEFETACIHFDSAANVLIELPSVKTPGSYAYRVLALVYGLHANALTALSRLEDAIPFWRKEVAMNKNSTSHSNLAFCLARSLPEESIELCNKLGRRDNLSNSEKYNLACAWAIIARNQNGDQNGDLNGDLNGDQLKTAREAALRYLTQIRDSGYFDDATRVEKLIQSGSFSALKDLPEFVEFVEQCKVDK